MTPEEFVRHMATFPDTPAGQALIAADPEMVVRLLIDMAKSIANR
jgi:hypothetical protein